MNLPKIPLHTYGIVSSVNFFSFNNKLTKAAIPPAQAPNVQFIPINPSYSYYRGVAAPTPPPLKKNQQNHN